MIKSTSPRGKTRGLVANALNFGKCTAQFRTLSNRSSFSVPTDGSVGPNENNAWLYSGVSCLIDKNLSKFRQLEPLGF
jgi:hypothetical protein